MLGSLSKEYVEAERALRDVINLVNFPFLTGKCPVPPMAG